ncbi:MAG TPA: FAD-dependent oxidoreductase, partial [Bacilli bacterium]
AQLYYQFNKQGLERIEEIVNKEALDCDFKKVDGYLFSYANEEKNLQNELKVYQEIGIPGEMTKIDFFDGMALKVPNQAIFNPLKYLQGLLKILVEQNINIYVNTKAYKIENNIVFTDKGKITADHIIIATSYPIYPNHNLFFTKLMPSISYAVCGKAKVNIPNANYINTKDPTIAIRYYDDLMIISGASHKNKDFRDPHDRYHFLKNIGKTYFQIEKFDYAWSTRDYTTVDYLPFVGKVDENIYIATGYGKWGMTNGVASSLLIRDIIMKEDTIYKDAFHPYRCVTNKQFWQYTFGMVKTIIKSKKFYEHLTDINVGEGRIIKFRNKQYGVYRDEDNTVYIADVACTHMGCGLLFNKIDRTYDCPCHGSKFNYDGKLISGPAKKDLRVIKITSKEQNEYHH